MIVDVSSNSRKEVDTYKAVVELYVLCEFFLFYTMAKSCSLEYYFTWSLGDALTH